MLTRFSRVAVLLACLSAPTVGANSSFDEAIAKAASISGRWVGKLNHEESSIFAPDSISDLILNVHTRIRQDRETVKTSFLDVRLELGINIAGLESPLYERIYLGHAVPTGENGV